MTERWDEQSLSEMSGSFWQSCTLQAGVKLDIFTLLETDEKSPEDIAGAIGGDLRGITALLDALSAMGLLRKRKGLFSCVEASSRYLNRASEEYIGWRILHHHYLLPSWARLDEAVLKGEPIRDERAATRHEDQREAFLMAMFNNASAVAERIIPFIKLESPASLLDLGGGPATYAIHFCRRYPGLQAVVYDLPTSRPYAEDTIRKYGMQDRIEFKGGDFFIDDIPGEYEVVWMSHVLHSSGPEECRRLVRKAAEVLKPGGVLLLHDFWLDESGGSPLFPALFALNMLVRTAKGRTYRESEGKEMLSLAGLKNIRRLDLDVPNDSGVIMAEKKD